MSDSTPQEFNRLEFESQVFNHYQTHSLSKMNLAQLASGKGLAAEPSADEGWGHWVYRNVVAVPFEHVAKWAMIKHENSPDNLKRQKMAEALLADTANRERFAFHLSQVSREGRTKEEWEILLIKAVVAVYDENPGETDLSKTDPQVIARLVWELLSDKGL